MNNQLTIKKLIASLQKLIADGADENLLVCICDADTEWYLELIPEGIQLNDKFNRLVLKADYEDRDDKIHD